MRVATLGPSGSCSEEAALGFLRERGEGEVAPILTRSFEDAAGFVLSSEAEYAIVPAAYINLHDSSRYYDLKARRWVRDGDIWP